MNRNWLGLKSCLAGLIVSLSACTQESPKQASGFEKSCYSLEQEIYSSNAPEGVVEDYTPRREEIVMKTMAKARKNQGRWVKELENKYGSQKPQRIIGYLDDPSKLGLLEAIYRAHDMSGLDPNFISATAFGEGLVLWMREGGYKVPETDVDAYQYVGTDRFGKEVNSYEQRMKVSGVKVGGNSLSFRVNSFFWGDELIEINPTRIRMDADSIRRVDGKVMAEAGGNTVEIDARDLTVRTKGLIERGILREDYNIGDEFKVDGFEASERGEPNPSVTFNDIGAALEGLGAMLKRRREIFLQDVRDAGFDASRLSRDQVDYWTYVYFNAGSAPPEDLFGVGRSIVERNLKNYGLDGLKIPESEQEAWSIHANAQRVIGTKKLLDRALGDGLPSYSPLALSE